MDELIECLRETRTWQQELILLWQRLYLWRRFRKQDTGTKRKLAKVLRVRLADMSRAEWAVYVKHNYSLIGGDKREKLEARNLKERLMIVSILGDMYRNFTGPEYLGTE